MKVIGYKNYSFKDKDDSTKLIEGTNIFLSEDIDEKYGFGSQVEKVNLSPSKVKDLPCPLLQMIGLEVKVEYNKYGKAEYLEPR